MTDREFRELGPDHRVTFQEYVDYAFDAASGPTAYDPGEVPDRLDREFGVFEGGDLRSVCTHHDFTARVREDWLPLAGLAAVATPPEHRRRGLVRTTVRESLRLWRGEYPFAALWPFEHAYYRQFGWALANKSVRYTCPPAALGFARGREGSLWRVEPDDWEQLQDVHEAHGRSRGLTLRRDGEWWRQRVFRSIGGGRRYVYALDRDGVDGYVVYTVEGDRLRVNDLAFRDHDAYCRLLAFLADHDSQVEEVRFYREEGSELFDLVDEPEAVECTVSPGAQIRIVDVERAIEALSYPDDAAGTVRLAVTDGQAPWNDRTFEVTVADGAADARPVDGGGSAVDGDGDPDASVDIGTLAQLAVGTHGAERARRLGGLDAPSEVVGILSEWFPPRTVNLREFF